MVVKIPQVDKVLRHPALVEAETYFRRDILTQLVREDLDVLRSGKSELSDELEAIAQRVAFRAASLRMPSLRKVINGTGVVLNTNLGRAPLPERALAELIALGSGYCNLEINLQTGKRGERSRRIGDLLRLLIGSEAAVVVNNNAAAVVLAVNCFARDKEVIVSRGELIEIGGSFRLPDVIVAAGGILKEVGTTNRTRVSDYKSAIGTNTGLMVRCHRSNFEVRGFTEQPQLDELVALSKDSGIPLLEDLGSGMLFNLAALGVGEEPTVQDIVKSGCDMVSFSGDKLLGGPQAGIIAGRKATIEKLAKHALYRALRPDKITLALLERVFASYLSPQPEKEIPVLNMIAFKASDIKARCDRFSRRARKLLTKIKCETVKTTSTTGGGSLPGEEVESYGIILNTAWKTNEAWTLLRDNEPPIIAIVHDDKVILDFRTIFPGDEPFIMDALLRLDKKG